MRVIPRLVRPLPTVEPALRVERRRCFGAACRLVVLWLALNVLVTPLSAQTRKIIIDCDPGIDDAMALAIALQHPGFEILGITTTFGNATIEQATKNALRIVEVSGKSVPVYRGAGRPLRVPLKPPPDFVQPGNVSPVGEANIAGDPDAADSVFTAPWKVTMVGLDVTTRVRLDEAVLARVKARNARFGPFLYAISRFYEAFHQKEVTGGFYVHDPSAVVFLIQPDLFETKRGPMRVVRDGIAIGQTIMAAYDYQFELPPWKGQPLVTATVRVDAERFQRTVERLLVGDPR